MNHTLLVGGFASFLLALCVGGCQTNEPSAASTSTTLADAKSLRVYVGTYTREKSKGIYLYDFDLATGALKPVGVAAETANPSFLALSPDNEHLYAVGEVGEFQGK